METIHLHSFHLATTNLAYLGSPSNLPSFRYLTNHLSFLETFPKRFSPHSDIQNTKAKSQEVLFGNSVNNCYLIQFPLEKRFSDEWLWEGYTARGCIALHAHTHVIFVNKLVINAFRKA